MIRCLVVRTENWLAVDSYSFRTIIMLVDENLFIFLAGVSKSVLEVKICILIDRTYDLGDLLNSTIGPNLEHGEFQCVPVIFSYKSIKTIKHV